MNSEFGVPGTFLVYTGTNRVVYWSLEHGNKYYISRNLFFNWIPVYTTVYLRLPYILGYVVLRIISYSVDSIYCTPVPYIHIGTVYTADCGLRLWVSRTYSILFRIFSFWLVKRMIEFGYAESQVLRNYDLRLIPLPFGAHRRDIVQHQTGAF